MTHVRPQSGLICLMFHLILRNLLYWFIGLTCVILYSFSVKLVRRKKTLGYSVIVITKRSEQVCMFIVLWKIVYKWVDYKNFINMTTRSVGLLSCLKNLLGRELVVYQFVCVFLLLLFNEVYWRDLPISTSKKYSLCILDTHRVDPKDSVSFPLLQTIHPTNNS